MSSAKLATENGFGRPSSPFVASAIGGKSRLAPQRRSRMGAAILRPVHRAVVEQVVAELEIAPPERLAVGRGTAFVIGGYCYHPGARTRASGGRGRGQAAPGRALPAAAPGRLRAGSGAPARPATALPQRLRRDADADARARARAISTWICVLTLAGGLEVCASARQRRGQNRCSRRPTELLPRLSPSGRVRAWRSAWRPTTRRRAARAPARLDPRADPRQLGLPDQRRRLATRAPSSACAREVDGDPRFVVSPKPTAGSASTGTSSGRCRWRRPRPTSSTLCDQDDRWHPTSSSGCSERIDDGASSPTATPRVVEPRRRAGPRLLLDGPPQQLHELRLAAARQHRHRRRIPLPARAARRRAALPAPPRRALPRSLARAGRPRARRDRLRRRAPLRLRPARRRGDRPRQANRRPLPVRAAPAGAAAQARVTARASSTTTTGTSSCSSPRCCGCAAGSG